MTQLGIRHDIVMQASLSLIFYKTLENLLSKNCIVDVALGNFIIYILKSVNINF